MRINLSSLLPLLQFRSRRHSPECSRCQAMTAKYRSQFQRRPILRCHCLAHPTNDTTRCCPYHNVYGQTRRQCFGHTICCVSGSPNRTRVFTTDSANSSWRCLGERVITLDFLSEKTVRSLLQCQPEYASVLPPHQDGSYQSRKVALTQIFYESSASKRDLRDTRTTISNQQRLLPAANHEMLSSSASN